MPPLSKGFISNHLLMYQLALTLPPFYFIVRKRYLVALGLTGAMIYLFNWNPYYTLAVVLLAVLSQSIQLIVDLYFHIAYEPETEETPELELSLN